MFTFLPDVVVLSESSICGRENDRVPVACRFVHDRSSSSGWLDSGSGYLCFPACINNVQRGGTPKNTWEDAFVDQDKGQGTK